MERESPVLCVDVAVCSPDKKFVLLIRRAYDPDAGKLALPGGHFDMTDESVARAAARELEEETGVTMLPDQLEFLTFLDAPNRDPRGRVISAVYVARKIPINVLRQCRAGSDAKEIVIRELGSIKPEEMAFDHYRVIELLKHGGRR